MYVARLMIGNKCAMLWIGSDEGKQQGTLESEVRKYVNWRYEHKQLACLLFFIQRREIAVSDSKSISNLKRLDTAS